MIDLKQLQEAADLDERCGYSEWDGMIAGLVRAVLDAPTIKWCSVHQNLAIDCPWPLGVFSDGKPCDVGEARVVRVGGDTDGD